jgi:hypothetical protein
MTAKLLGLLAAGLLAGPLAADAALVTYNFAVNGGASGLLAGVESSGYFAIDETRIPGSGGTVYDGLFDDFAFSWNGMDYTESDVRFANLSFNASGTLVNALLGNNCSGNACTVRDQTSDWWIDTGPAGFFYALPQVSGSYLGTVEFSSRVPEPGTLALLGLGLAGLGFVRRRNTACARQSS